MPHLEWVCGFRFPSVCVHFCGFQEGELSKQVLLSPSSTGAGAEPGRIVGHGKSGRQQLVCLLREILIPSGAKTMLKPCSYGMKNGVRQPTGRECSTQPWGSARGGCGVQSPDS